MRRLLRTLKTTEDQAPRESDAVTRNKEEYMCCMALARSIRCHLGSSASSVVLGGTRGTGAWIRVSCHLEHISSPWIFVLREAGSTGQKYDQVGKGPATGTAKAGSLPNGHFKRRHVEVHILLASRATQAALPPRKTERHSEFQQRRAQRTSQGGSSLIGDFNILRTSRRRAAPTAQPSLTEMAQGHRAAQIFPARPARVHAQRNWQMAH